MRVALSVAVFGLLLAFQNCAKNQSATSTAENASEQVIGSASSYTKIVYDPRLESRYEALPATRVELDLKAGRVTVNDVACELDEARLGSLRALLAQSNVCRPAPPPPNFASCMAIGLADIELSGERGTAVQLRPLVCNNGTFLCDGNDKILREILKDLEQNSPCSI